MKKIIYCCDDCKKELPERQLNAVLLMVNLEEYKKYVCDKCAQETVNKFTRR